MKSSVGLAAILAALFVTLAFAQSSDKPAVGAPKYDKATETVINGVIEEVKDFECPVSGGLGAHFTVKGATGPTLVHIALTKFMKEYEIAFAKGQLVEVLGSKVKMEGTESILARQITRGQVTYTFRDAKGKPLW